MAKRVKIPKMQRALGICGMALSLLSAVIASSYLLSDHFLQRAVAATNNKASSKDPTAAERQAQNAVYLAPYRASAWLILAQYEDAVYRQKYPAGSSQNTSATKQNQSSAADEAKKKIANAAGNAAALAPHDPQILSNAAVLVGNYGDGLQALDMMKQAWENGRYHIQYPEQYMGYAEIIATNLYNNDKTKAKTYFETTLNTYHDIEQRIANFKNLPAVLKPEYPYDPTPNMHLYAGEAAFYMGQWQEAERILTAVSTMSNATDQDKLKAEAILAAIAEKQGKKNDAGLLEQIQKNKELYTYYSQLKNIEPLK